MQLGPRQEVRAGLLKVAALCFCMGVAGAILLAAASLLLAVSRLGRNVTVIGIFIGATVAISLYRVWGAASCLADISLILTSGLAVIGSIVLQRSVCSIPQERLPSLIEVCAPNNQRASMYGNILAVLFGCFPIWLAIRYLTWRARKEPLG